MLSPPVPSPLVKSPPSKGRNERGEEGRYERERSVWEIWVSANLNVADHIIIPRPNEATAN